MRDTSRIVVSLGIAIGLLAGSPVWGDLGSIWVEKVGASSITINWSNPTGIHRMYRDAFHYRVCWLEVNPYENSYPTISAECEFLFNSADRPFTITGLRQDTYYRIKVEAFTEKRTTDGTWINPELRQVGSVRQKTLAEPPGRNLRLAGSGQNWLEVEFVNCPPGFDRVRLAYKQKWSSVHLCDVAGNALGPIDNWEVSSSERGWVDLFPAPVLKARFTGLVPRQAYEIVAYGHRIGVVEGERLGRLAGATGGFRPNDRMEEVLAADFQDVLESYARRVNVAHGMTRIVGIVGESFPTLLEDEAFLIADEGDDLTDDLTCLLFLIGARQEMFDSWQIAEEAEGVPLKTYLTQEYAYLDPVLRSDVDPTETWFRRGDSNTDGAIDLSDGVSIMNALFLGIGRIDCLDAADANDDAVVDLSDGIYVLLYLFMDGDAPADPFGACGPDSTPDELGCSEFHVCPP